jgi:hydrogenase assembly chaperone HypC/HupF
MCLTIPGKIVEIGENHFVVDYVSEKRVVEINLIDGLKVGDFVIVSNKIIVAKVGREKASKFLEMINEH